MCINLNPSICDFLPSRCGVCNSCGCHGKEERWEAGRKQTLRIHTGYRTSDTSYTQICVLYLHRLMILKWEDWTQMCPTHCCMYWRACEFANLFRIEKKKIVPLVFSNCLSDLNKWSVNEMVCHGVVCNGVGDWTWYSKLIKCCRLVWAESFPLHC